MKDNSNNSTVNDVFAKIFTSGVNIDNKKTDNDINIKEIIEKEEVGEENEQERETRKEREKREENPEKQEQEEQQKELLKADLKV